MKTVVFAYHNLGCVGLEALRRHGFEIEAVFTHKDNPSENIWFRSVAELATGLGIAVFAPDDINHPLWVERIRRMQPEAIFSFYYRQILHPPILDLASAGCFNLHGSLLPRYRGRAPINWVLVHGEKETGVTLHHMTSKPDEGDIVAARAFPIEESDTALTLHGKAAEAAVRLLDETLPKIKARRAPRTPQDPALATCFGGRTPDDGRIDWRSTAHAIANLVRAVTRPYPGAFTYSGDRHCIIWSATPLAESAGDTVPGTILSVDPLVVSCGEGSLRVESGQESSGVICGGAQLARDLSLAEGMRLGDAGGLPRGARKKTVLILGINGFIGCALSERLLESAKYEVHGIDLRATHLGDVIGRPGFHFTEGDIAIHREWIEYHVKKCDVAIPLVAIATPIEYTRNPLRVFELDFEENLRVIRYCVKYGKRVVFPSTSEVYGMCDDDEFDEDNSRLITGPIRMQRWIYSCSKQLLDRVIWAYGKQVGLRFTLFRPFNWIGPRLDSLESARIGSSRAVTQLILNLVEGTPIQLIDGGEQQRCFTDITDGIEALYRILENEDGRCDSQIINIGNPDNEMSIRGLAELLVAKFEQHPLRGEFPPFAGFRKTESRAYYGEGYQDVQYRKPSIRNARKLLGWRPTVGMETSIDGTLDFFLKQALEKRKGRG